MPAPWRPATSIPAEHFPSCKQDFRKCSCKQNFRKCSSVTHVAFFHTHTRYKKIDWLVEKKKQKYFVTLTHDLRNPATNKQWFDPRKTLRIDNSLIANFLSTHPPCPWVQFNEPPPAGGKIDISHQPASARTKEVSCFQGKQIKSRKIQPHFGQNTAFSAT